MTRPPIATAAAVLLLLALAACGDDDPTGETTANQPLIDHTAWTVPAQPADPFAARRSDDSFCNENGFAAEALGGVLTLGIETVDCNFLSVVQPAGTSLRAGDTVRIRLYHFDLSAPEPAETYLGLAAGANVIWEHQVPIPSDAGLVEATFALEEPVAAGTPVTFHLDNHGTNSWALIEIIPLDESIEAVD